MQRVLDSANCFFVLLSHRVVVIDLFFSHVAASTQMKSNTFNAFCDRFVGRSQFSALSFLVPFDSSSESGSVHCDPLLSSQQIEGSRRHPQPNTVSCLMFSQVHRSALMEHVENFHTTQTLCKQQCKP